MASKDNELAQRINAYTENEYQRYISWYAQNSKIAKNNLVAACVVVLVCTLFIAFFPGPMDEMSFLQYSFDPTNAIKFGLFASIILAIYSMYTTFKQMNRCLAIKAKLQSEYEQFDKRDKDNAGPHDAAAFKAFKSGVDGIMAASNPDVVIAVERDNAKKEKSPQA